MGSKQDKQYQAVRVDGSSGKPRRVSKPDTAENARAVADKRHADLSRTHRGSSTWYEVRPTR
jgi:hypothetical protein